MIDNGSGYECWFCGHDRARVIAALCVEPCDRPILLRTCTKYVLPAVQARFLGLVSLSPRPPTRSSYFPLRLECCAL